MTGRPATGCCTAPTGVRRRGLSLSAAGRCSSEHPAAGLFLLAALAIAVLSGCSQTDPAGGGTQGAGEVEVAIVEFDYEPADLTTPTGTTVVWTNEDMFGHTVTSGTPRDPEDLFDGTLGETIDGEGKTFEHTFPEAGTYPYFRRFHTNMIARVVVEDA